MSDEEKDKLLKQIPNSEKAKDGIIIHLRDGNLFHVTGVYSQNEKLEQNDYFYRAYCSENDIKKIKTTTSSFDELLKLQADTIIDSARLVRVFRKRMEHIKLWSLEYYYKKRDQNLYEYINFLSKNKNNKLKKTPIGRIYSNEVNAMCIKSKHGNIIVISELLEYYLYFMNIFYFGKQFNLSDEDILTSFLIAQRILYGYESLDFDLDPRCILPEHIEKYVKKTVDNQIKFVLGHEIAHHLLGHLNDSRIISKRLSAFSKDYKGNESISYYNYQHKFEYEADYYSIKNFKQDSSLSKSDYVDSGFLLLMFFHANHLLKEYISPCNKMPSTHPKPIDRINNIRKRINNKFGMSSDKLKDRILFLEKYTESVIKHQLIQNMDKFEIYGSYYLPSYKETILKDRIDF